MDDLDHSMHISEDDWTSFWEESEECSLLKPSIARPDSFSDSEDLEESSGPVSSTDQDGTLQSCDVNRDGAEASAVGCRCDEGGLAQVDSEMSSTCPTGNPPEVIATTDNTTGFPNRPKTVKQAPSVNEPRATEGAEGQDVSRVHSREEKERWFVTIDESLVRRPTAGFSGKKKRRQKRPCKKARGDKRESEGGEVQLMQNLIHKPGEGPSAKMVEAEESDEFFSIHSQDSESYSSAPEAAEEPLNRVEGHLPLTTSLPPHTQSRETDHGDNTPSCTVSASSGDGAEPPLVFPSAGEGADSTCDDATELHQPSLNDPGSSGHHLGSGSTVTPSSVANSPETCAEPLGPTRPVYAISSFWDEMEKLTINDILQLRTGRETPTPGAHDPPTNHPFLIDSVKYDSSDCGPTDASDIADSDYFTQPDESKPEGSSWEFSTSDLEEEYWHFVGSSGNPSPDPRATTPRRTSDSSFLSREETSCSEGQVTPVPSKGCPGQRVADQESVASPQSRPMTRSKTRRNIQALEENMALIALSAADTLDTNYQISIPEVFEYFFTEDSTCASIYNPEDIPVAPVLGYTLRNEMSFSSLCDSQLSKDNPIPIFSCSHSSFTERTYPHSAYPFYKADHEDVNVSHAVTSGAAAAAAAASSIWGSLLSRRTICFPNRGGMWCRRSGAWVLPPEGANRSDKTNDLPTTAATEGGASGSPAQLLKDVALHPRIWETLHTRREGIFSTLKQSDMCLVCIAFASWVLRSSNPEGADAWKAALLANVSALSAIQFLRQYVKTTTPQEDP